jgi:predicted DNA-binding transcriptional regulator AlpA
MRSDALAGLSEVADLLGVTKRTAQRYTKRADFPEPIATLAATPVWKQRDVEKWREAMLPLPRDPRARRTAG